MATVLFVHGTGVRADKLADTLRRVREGCAAFAPGIDRVLAPAWGEVCGVGGTNSGLLPDPDPDAAAAAHAGALPGPRQAPPGEASPGSGSGSGSGDGDGGDPPGFSWQDLYGDPALEIRVVAAAQAAVPQGGPGYGREMRDAVLAAPGGFGWQEYAGTVPEGLRVLLAAAASMLAGSETPAVPAADWDWFAEAGGNTLLARALTAQFAALASEQPGFPADFDPETMAEGLEEVFGGREQNGLGDGFLAGAKVAYVLGSKRAVRKHRDRIHDAADLFVGDILVYQAHGQRARDHLKTQIEKALAEDPAGNVVVVGHSLGGIAAFETFTGADFGPRARLFTVGSQISRLYRYGALATLAPGSAPARWPHHWTNAFCPQDLLGFSAHPDFGDDVPVTDVPIDTGLTFPDAHSGYWARRRTYEIIAELAGRRP